MITLNELPKIGGCPIIAYHWAGDSFTILALRGDSVATGEWVVARSQYLEADEWNSGRYFQTYDRAAEVFAQSAGLVGVPPADRRETP